MQHSKIEFFVKRSNSSRQIVRKDNTTNNNKDSEKGEQSEDEDIMRRPNCSAPIPPPGQPRGQRKYACDKKGRGTRKKGDFGDYIGRGK